MPEQASKIHPIDEKPALAVRVALLEERNLRIERDKAWETSWFRRLLIMMIIYTCATLFLLLIGDAHPYLTALVPPSGFLLSILGLPIIKKVWINEWYKD